MNDRERIDDPVVPVPAETPELPAESPPAETPLLSAESQPAESQPAEFNEDLYRATATILSEPESTVSPLRNLGWLLFSLVLFAVTFWNLGFWTLGLLVVVLIFHELGHLFGMRLFGYRNLRMFFIPFLGAAAAGSKHAAPVWQQGVVLLLGPLPGLALAFGLQLAFHPVRNPLLNELIGILVFLNLFNLLPIYPLDGGRLVDLLFFARRPVLAVLFTLFAAFALAAFAWLAQSIVLGILALFIALIAPARYHQAKIQRALRANLPGWPEQMEQMTDTQLRDLFGWAVLLNPQEKGPTQLAVTMRNLHESVVSRPAGYLAGALLSFFYLAGFALGFGFAALPEFLWPTETGIGAGDYHVP